MFFRPIPCHKSLQPFIRNYWLLTAHCTARGTQRIYSNGAASLHFYRTQHVQLEGSQQRYRASLNRHDLSCMEVSTEATDGSQAALDADSVSPSDLASAACLSQKQFTRVFSEYVGMNPKSYLRLLRFHKALQQLRHFAAHTPLTEIAWECGYYDLSHMINEFRQLCGHTPSEVLEMGAQLTEAFQSDCSGLMKKKVLVENVE